MNVFLLSEIHRPEPGRVRPYPDASHPRSGERERIIRSQNPMSTLFQKNFSYPIFSIFPNIFHHFPSAPLPRPQTFFTLPPPLPSPFPSLLPPKRNSSLANNIDFFDKIDNFEHPLRPVFALPEESRMQSNAVDRSRMQSLISSSASSLRLRLPRGSAPPPALFPRPRLPKSKIEIETHSAYYALARGGGVRYPFRTYL